MLEQFDQPFMCAFSDNDLVTAGGDKSLVKKVPGCNGVEHPAFSPAGHFFQQDQPELCVTAILDLQNRLRSTSE